jgi:Dolichyl-phosphate-mannose-protein mannosyltransferase
MDSTFPPSVNAPEKISLSGQQIAGESEESVFCGSMMIAWFLAAAAVVLQAVTNGRYGYFRDELYFLACGDHLAWGYVDFAPLVALLARVSRAVMGDSLHAIRLLPALALGAEIVLTGLIARELGGKRFAVFLACVSVLMAPVILNNATRLSMNPFESLFWMGCVYFLLRAINGDEPRLLVWCGVMLGLGLENKHSTAFFFVSLLAGLLLTSARQLILTKWFWIAAGIALLIFLPNLLWQMQHHFPTLEALRNVKATHKNVELPPLHFFQQQVFMLNRASVLVWIAGLGFLLVDRRTKSWRVLGITYVVFLGIMMALKGKDYYLAPIYPMLFAAGGVFWEAATEARPRLRWVRVGLPAVVIAIGLVAVPLVVPILPVEKIVPYMGVLGIKMSRTEVQDRGPLPQHFGDEFGWPEMVSEVAKVYNSLPPEQRAKTGILAGTYGDAGAIDFFGPRLALPKSISGHQNYYLWGPREYTGESLIVLHYDLEDVQRWCQSVQVGPKLDPYYGMAEEHYTILVCSGLKKPLAEVWPRFKVWN